MPTIIYVEGFFFLNLSNTVYYAVYVIVGEDILFSMINYHQGSNMMDYQFCMKQLLKPENSFLTIGFEPMPSDCEQEAYTSRKSASLWEVFECRGQFTVCHGTICI